MGVVQSPINVITVPRSTLLELLIFVVFILVNFIVNHVVVEPSGHEKIIEGQRLDSEFSGVAVESK